ncbi:MAG: Rieske 2Fe-2S domain-containing protein [Gemmatimonadetes bacterium]|nr:Rieske 2Fe-2S domain-containing protein [Gemmatimonadota bacterium]
METEVEFVKVATTEELEPGAMKAVDVAGEEVLLCRIGDEYHAVHDECTHECFPLSEGTLDEHVVTCMLHGAKFDVRTGEVLALPAYGPVKTYKVRVEGDEILVGAE